MNFKKFPTPNSLDRRAFLRLGGSAALLGLAGCSTTQAPRSFAEEAASRFPRTGGFAAGAAPGMPYYISMYGARPDEKFPLPAIPVERIDPSYFRQLVDDPTGERPGTIVVDTANHFLYFTTENGKARRYGVGLGRAGFDWAGRGVIQYKRAWPRWTPPDTMVARQPELEPYSIANGGMEPGLNNPLGARALYIFQNGEDTLYRIHGTPEWSSIGQSVSSGCVRMFSQDVIDLHERVPNRTPILVTSLGPIQSPLST
ncbi:L,D-transpeptidase [Allomesorhizobium camelthorni]|jgi:lipoprotein-anchoring transpeptidase ErfK/SrfK|uniref:L,D-transpeptidase n=1 Tax=Allomesorhizobium camelthorni TaxID=475069 RepID=A0A6G4WNN5_9HYPH|nr:L,D-transpeptidase [Mesorhizobium camelthorni]NGO55677.1 L,D-transpeptidase [Mesorhizobium camelthorni]